MKYLFIALLSGLTTIIYGQNRLSGRVTNQQQENIAGVSIYIPELDRGTVTDTEGFYQFRNLPSGSHKVVFSFLGYASQTVSILMQGTDLEQVVVLLQNVHVMDEVIVSTAFNRLQSENVMKVEHLNIRQMQQLGVTTLAEGITVIPGVSQISTGVSIGKPVIRGLTGNRVLVYAQGTRLENQQFGEEHGLGLSDAGVESVEVIKGPASLLYGSDALGGIIYFNPEKFADANDFTINFNQRLYSNTLGTSSSLGIKGSTEHWRFLSRASYASHSDYRIGESQNRVINTRFNEKDFKVAAGYTAKDFSLTFRYNFNKIDLGLPEEAFDGASTSKVPDYPKQEVFNHILSAQNSIYFGKSKLETNLGYTRNSRSEFEDSEVAVLDMDLSTLNYNIKFHFPRSEKWEVIAGLQGMHQDNRNHGEELLIPDADLTDAGIFSTFQFTWKKNILLAGVRYDYRKLSTLQAGDEGEEGYFAPVDRSFSSINASLGYKASLTEKLSARINLASGFRSPNLAELTSNGVHEGSNRYEIGNSMLKNEQNIQADLNLEYKNSHFEFFINGFYNHVNKYIYITPTGETLEENAVYKYVQDDARLFGGEAGIHFHPHPLDWLHFESTFETVTGMRNGGNYLPLIPANIWSNTIRTEFSVGRKITDFFARINLQSVFDQDNVSEFETRTGGYTLLNVGTGGVLKLGRASAGITLNANNLLDRRYTSHLSRLKNDQVPNIGRNIMLGINFTI